MDKGPATPPLQVVERANDSVYGLASGLITNDVNVINTVTRSLRAGTVWVNCYNVFTSEVPFGEFGSGPRTACLLGGLGQGACMRLVGASGKPHQLRRAERALYMFPLARCRRLQALWHWARQGRVRAGAL